MSKTWNLPPVWLYYNILHRDLNWIVLIEFALIWSDVPSAPRGPLVVDLKEDFTSGNATAEALLSWAESENDGGAPIVEYELAMRELAPDAGAGGDWQSIARVTPARRMKEPVSGLSAGSSYRFRVRYAPLDLLQCFSLL